MCGIVGYIGNKPAKDILLNGLSKLEYRGYDSAGVAIRNENGFDIIKSKGKLENLKNKLKDKNLLGTCGIGHTRWATHGEPTEFNAHPHNSYNENVVVVHNGIIENYLEVKEKLVTYGYTFYSQTDTEVIAKLIDFYLNETNQNPIQAISKFMLRVKGSYALAIMFKNLKDEIYVARKDSPLIIGICNNENFIASDVPAILRYTKDVYYLDNYQMAKISTNSTIFYNIDGMEVKKKLTHIQMDLSSAEKNGFEHFMLKEIHEQPEAIEKTIKSMVKNEDIFLDRTGITNDFLSKIENIFIIGCGSAYHVGITLKYVFEKLANINVQVDFASEFRYRNPVLLKNTLLIVISQSGETADSLAGLKEAKKQKVPTLGIVNVVGSSIAREVDYVLYTLAGPEISVATTKAYSAQLVAGYLLAIKLAECKNKINQITRKKLIKDVIEIPDKISVILKRQNEIQMLSSKFVNVKNIFLIGRNIDYAVVLEGSLKMKEVSYIHTEAYPAGELKHGTISLIENNSLVIGSISNINLAEKTFSNMLETKSRGATLLGFLTKDIRSTICDYVFEVPQINPLFANSLVIVPMQIMSYYLSVLKGNDVDKPRNLAKSVTVE